MAEGTLWAFRTLDTHTSPHAMCTHARCSLCMSDRCMPSVPAQLAVARLNFDAHSSRRSLKPPLLAQAAADACSDARLDASLGCFARTLQARTLARKLARTLLLGCSLGRSCSDALARMLLLGPSALLSYRSWFLILCVSSFFVCIYIHVSRALYSCANDSS